MKRNPILSAILNLIAPGLGYLYNGQHLLYSGILFIVSLFGIIYSTFRYISDSVIVGPLIIAIVVIGVTTAIGGYLQAKRINFNHLQFKKAMQESK